MGTGIMYSTYTKPKYKHVDIYYNSLRINHVNVNNMDNIQGTSDSANVQKLKPLRQQRAPNFSTAQKSYLLELILDKQDIIESDNKNYMCVLKRTEAWKKDRFYVFGTLSRCKSVGATSKRFLATPKSCCSEKKNRC